MILRADAAAARRLRLKIVRSLTVAILAAGRGHDRLPAAPASHPRGRSSATIRSMSCSAAVLMSFTPGRSSRDPGPNLPFNAEEELVDHGLLAEAESRRASERQRAFE